MFSSNTSQVSSSAANYIEDVFSTWLYTGNGSTQTINNGLNLAGKGGLVWIKRRSSAEVSHFWFDTTRGALNEINSNNREAQTSLSNSLTSFGASGFTLGSAGEVNSFEPFVSWGFREQEKFFDVVTYTGTGSTRTIPHNLGSVPGFMIVKCTSTGTDDWVVYHRVLGSTDFLLLNQNSASAFQTSRWANAPTSTVFSVGSAPSTNASGQTYVAYLFAHNAGGFGLSGTDNVITCDSYTGNGNANGPVVTLGYEPQWLLIKSLQSTGNWQLIDNMRGFSLTADTVIRVNQAFGEYNVTNFVQPTATGFRIATADFDLNEAGAGYAYIAIRRGPMRVPTTGTSVFNPAFYNGNVTTNRLVTTGLVTDAVFVRNTNNDISGSFRVASRLTGDQYLRTSLINAETTSATAFMPGPNGLGNSFSIMNGFGVGTDSTAYLNNSTNNIAEAFRRAPNFFDVVCYTATGAIPSNIPHNLGVAPELMLIKKRNSSDTWTVYAQFFGANRETSFNNSGAPSINTNVWNNTAPTASVFTVGLSGAVNSSEETYVAYLFASCPGVSRVGNYTGTGATLTIDCGFPGGARFVMIRRNGVGNWWVWDTARGMVAGTNPRLAFNSDTQDTNNNWVYTTTGGFQIVTTDTSVNASGSTYLYLAIA